MRTFANSFSYVELTVFLKSNKHPYATNLKLVCVRTWSTNCSATPLTAATILLQSSATASLFKSSINRTRRSSTGRESEGHCGTHDRGLKDNTTSTRKDAFFQTSIGNSPDSQYPSPSSRLRPSPPRTCAEGGTRHVPKI